MQRAGIRPIGFYVPAAVIVWIAVLESGVHATIAGVLLGALTPAGAELSQWSFARRIHHLSRRLSRTVVARDHDKTEMLAAHVEELGRQSESPLERTERLFHPWSSYVILPLFALANTGVVLSGGALHEAIHNPVSYAVAAGLLLGKPLGIVSVAWVATRAGLASLPDTVRWRDLAGIGMLGGIGFTVSIFITDLAFADDSLVASAKLAIFAASLLAAAGGWLVARRP